MNNRSRKEKDKIGEIGGDTTSGTKRAANDEETKPPNKRQLVGSVADSRVVLQQTRHRIPYSTRIKLKIFRFLDLPGG